MLIFQKDISAVQRLQELNPLCQVSVFEGDALAAVAAGDPSILQRFSAITLCTFMPLAFQAGINRQIWNVFH